MSSTYRAVNWMPPKKAYDLAIAFAVVTYLFVFITIGKVVHRGDHAISDPILLLRALGTCAYLMLHVVLCIGPLARLDKRFLPLVFNRRHLGVATFCVAAIHGLLVLGWYHGFGIVTPFESLLTSNTQYGSIVAFPFEFFGIVAFLILFLMAATSHDFWLHNLSPVVWKRLHMLVYVAWALLVMHVALGALQSERSVVYPIMTAVGVIVVCALHLLARRREVRQERGGGGSPIASTFPQPLPGREGSETCNGGYLPVPPGQRRFNRWVVRALLVIVAASAALIAAMQRDPGDATWDPEEDITVRGLLLHEPYPMLSLRVGRHRIATVLIVSAGKFGAVEATKPHVGKLVQLRGSILEREPEPRTRWMLELKSTDDAVGVPDPMDRIDIEKLRLPAATPGRAVQLTGEIIDPKCYMGAMKPGDGKTHKACATLCLRGGIPPMLVTFDQGRPRYLLLTDATGAALTGAALERLLPYVGDAVRVEGVEVTAGDVTWLRLRENAVTRL